MTSFPQETEPVLAHCSISKQSFDEGYEKTHFLSQGLGLACLYYLNAVNAGMH